MRFALYIAIPLSIGLLAWKLCFLAESAANALPALAQLWDEQVFGLDPDEVFRFIPAQSNTPNHSLGPSDHVAFMNGVPTVARGWDSIDLATAKCLDMPQSYLAHSRELPMPACGQWIADSAASTERRMQALQSLLSSITGKNIVIERLQPERRQVPIWMIRENATNQ
jgi:hypothetical protein